MENSVKGTQYSVGTGFLHCRHWKGRGAGSLRCHNRRFQCEEAGQIIFDIIKATANLAKLLVAFIIK